MRGKYLARRIVSNLARRLGLETYEPVYFYRENLARHTTYHESDRPIRDTRLTSRWGEDQDLTLTVEGLADVLDTGRHTGARILEVGPKYGHHSRWLDRHLAPAELVFSDFAQDSHLHTPWKDQIKCPHRWIYGDLLHTPELWGAGPFDLVLFLGVLYHSFHHVRMLAILNRLTRPGGRLLLATSHDPRPDAVLRLNWQNITGKAKAVPSLDALRVMLAWTGWRKATRYVNFRPGSVQVLLECEKTDEVPADADFAEIVTPHRPQEE
ncbi:MAG: class I SAM-dependent methyltransferase [Deltaproteobacteria bacterium]|nr:class I SAM-dependent methyltransferase [Deltaproteobacteria bacterium]